MKKVYEQGASDDIPMKKFPSFLFSLSIAYVLASHIDNLCRPVPMIVDIFLPFFPFRFSFH